MADTSNNAHLQYLSAMSELNFGTIGVVCLAYFSLLVPFEGRFLRLLLCIHCHVAFVEECSKDEDETNHHQPSDHVTIRDVGQHDGGKLPDVHGRCEYHCSKLPHLRVYEELASYCRDTENDGVRQESTVSTTEGKAGPKFPLDQQHDKRYTCRASIHIHDLIVLLNVLFSKELLLHGGCQAIQGEITNNEK